MREVAESRQKAREASHRHVTERLGTSTSGLAIVEGSAAKRTPSAQALRNGPSGRNSSFDGMGLRPVSSNSINSFVSPSQEVGR